MDSPGGTGTGAPLFPLPRLRSPASAPPLPLRRFRSATFTPRFRSAASTPPLPLRRFRSTASSPPLQLHRFHPSSVHCCIMRIATEKALWGNAHGAMMHPHGRGGNVPSRLRGSHGPSIDWAMVNPQSRSNVTPS